MKKCTTCKIFKKFTYFNIDKSRKSGYSYNCKECKKIQYFYRKNPKLKPVIIKL